MRGVAFFLLALIGGCTAPATNAPSLAPRAAEAIDPRLPIPDQPTSGPATPSLVAKLAVLVEQARAGDLGFQSAAAEAERMTSAAGEAQSESWVVAQQAVSAAVAAREPVTRALGDIDALGSSELAVKGGMSRADQDAIRAAAAAVGEIDARQSALINRLQRRLGG